MATNLLSFQTAGVRVYAASGNRKPDTIRRKSSSSNWWTPLFGWSSEPDYIDSDGKADPLEKPENKADSNPEPKSTRSSRFMPGCFTEEKAKRLRLMTMDTGSFHDVMYHSAIASRLASDFKNQSERER